MSRTGILGGSFDPPHNGHLAMALTALEKIPLDRVILMPSPHPPHKNPDDMTSYEIRLRMVELAIEGHPGLELSRLEESHGGPSYTVDTLERLRSELGGDVYLIIGADSAAELRSWKNPERILSLATIVLFARSGFESVVPVPGPASVVVFDGPVLDISSSEIRHGLSTGEAVAEFLPKPVHKFILDNSLYS